MTPEKTTALNVFLRAWSISALAEHLETDIDGALDFLEKPDIQEAIEQRAQRLHKLYSRMPKTVYVDLVMTELNNADAGTTATKFQALLNCFLQWYRETPAPSDTEFSQRVMALLKQE